MSKTKKIIHRIPHYWVIKEVRINMGGQKIGEVVKWMGKHTVYLSKRHYPDHYFVKYRGFGIDKALFWDLVSHDRIEWIVFEYIGKRGLWYFVSNVDDWAMHSHTERYVKERETTLETHGYQMFLCEDYMDELEVNIKC